LAVARRVCIDLFEVEDLVFLNPPAVISQASAFTAVCPDEISLAIVGLESNFFGAGFL